MLIYLVRHAIAVERQPAGQLSDRDRPLTARGIKKMRRIARALHRLGVAPAGIWSSPLIRAKQTAEILVATLDGNPPIEIMESLEPGGATGEIISRLKSSQSRLESVALVGHQPDLGELASMLLGTSRGVGLQIKKGGVVCIRIADLQPPFAGELFWLATPGILLQSK
jgi:phosphohistidine phosphatase